MPDDIKYDEYGGIINSDDRFSRTEAAGKKPRSGYNFLEKLLLKYSRKVNYLLDDSGRYSSRNEKIPPIIRLGPTNRCTARCLYCPREYVAQGGTGYMDLEVLHKIVDWAKNNHVRTISFALFGEPLIHPRIIEMIDCVIKNGFSFRFSTNGIALTENLAEKILKFPISAIEISMDGFNGREYLAGKQVDQYEKAKNNVLHLLKLAKAEKVKTLFNIHYVDIGNVSFSNRLKFVRFWKKELAGLNYATSFAYEPHNWAGTRNNLRKMMSLFDRWLSKWQLKKPCAYINGLNIDWNGDVYVCTGDPTSAAIIGNINQTPLAEIYNGERRMNYLSENEKGSFKDLHCGICTVNSVFPLIFIKKRLINKLSALLAKK